MTQHSKQSQIDQQKLHALSQKFVSRITDFLDMFSLEYVVYSNKIVGPCAIHGGDNPTSLTIYTEGDRLAGNWCCWTHHCQDDYVNTPIGLVRGILSSQYNRDVSFKESVSFVCEFLGDSLNSINVDNDGMDKAKFINYVNALSKERKRSETRVPRQIVKQSLKRPVEFYLRRGYNEETLEKFDVGICTNKNKAMFNRVVVPVYDDEFKHMIGCVGRTLKPECARCNYYHGPTESCPTVNYDKFRCSKWINNKGFCSGSYLYNYWRAKDHIQKTGTMVLVEGQGDVWRLEEAGIKNSVGMFGCALSQDQLLIIEKSGALNLVVVTDSDEAGIESREGISNQCDRLYNITYIDIPKKDVGEMTVEEIQDHITPIVVK